ncbi:hypothetical protein BOTBODRAFT_85881, partial [Botryobasidium botryosum FD-172 SS1]
PPDSAWTPMTSSKPNPCFSYPSPPMRSPSAFSIGTPTGSKVTESLSKNSRQPPLSPTNA